MAVSIIRTCILYLTIIALYRLMGKRQIGEMQPSELVLAIMVSDVATIPMQSASVPLLSGLLPICILMILEITLSFFAQKSAGMRRIITGAPNLIISDGNIDEKEMARLRFNIDDLFEQLRTSGYDRIEDVAYAILETNGMMSIIPKASRKPVTADDLHLAPPPALLSRCIIKDGCVDRHNLTCIRKDEAWLRTVLRKRHLIEKQVFLLCADQDGVTFLQPKKQKGGI